MKYSTRTSRNQKTADRQDAYRTGRIGVSPVQFFHLAQDFVSKGLISGIGIWILAIPTAIAGCSVAATPPPAPAPKTAPAVQIEPSWQQDWEKALAAAKQEGKLLIYTDWGPEFRIQVANALKEKFGIDTEWVVGRGSELIPKLTRERSSGLFLADFVITGVTSMVPLSAAGVIEPLEPALVWPEVKDPASWKDGELHFIDKDRRILAFYSRGGSAILVNSEMVKPEDLKSWRDLLDPKWKGKILINDPSVAGAGNATHAAILVLMGIDFLRDLARQEPVLTRDQRQQIEWIARGRYPILIGPDPGNMAEFKKIGAPIKHIVPAEGTFSGAGAGMIGSVNKAAHPAAAKVFINWFLSREGQTVAVTAALEQSRRLDVTTEFIDPDRRFQPGIKYIDGDSEFFIQKREETKTVTREIFAAQLSK